MPSPRCPPPAPTRVAALSLTSPNTSIVPHHVAAPFRSPRHSTRQRAAQQPQASSTRAPSDASQLHTVTPPRSIPNALPSFVLPLPLPLLLRIAPPHLRTIRRRPLSAPITVLRAPTPITLSAPPPPPSPPLLARPHSQHLRVVSTVDPSQCHQRRATTSSIPLQ